MIPFKVMLLAALMDIKRFGPKDNTVGICCNASKLVQGNEECSIVDMEVDDALGLLFITWPEKSISFAYPVGNWTDRPSNLFWHYSDSRKSMWDKKDHYGQARWALLDHCISKLGGTNG